MTFTPNALPKHFTSDISIFFLILTFSTNDSELYNAVGLFCPSSSQLWHHANTDILNPPTNSTSTCGSLLLLSYHTHKFSVPSSWNLSFSQASLWMALSLSVSTRPHLTLFHIYLQFPSLAHLPNSKTNLFIFVCVLYTTFFSLHFINPFLATLLFAFAL